jgi:hypothetical protein
MVPQDPVAFGGCMYPGQSTLMLMCTCVLCAVYHTTDALQSKVNVDTLLLFSSCMPSDNEVGRIVVVDPQVALKQAHRLPEVERNRLQDQINHD